mgnify:CR=1 FL=1
MDSQKDKILITGSNGFVGESLCKLLLQEGAKMNKCHGHSYTEKLGTNDFLIDLCKDSDWSSALKGCKTVIHLASRVHVIRENSKNPLEEFLKINLDGTVNLARQASELGIEKFIFLSSIGVNGPETYREIFDNDSVPRPYNPYTISKFEAEKALKKISKDSGMNLIIIRAPAIYGKNAPGNFKILEKLIMNGIPLPFRLVKNKRSFLHIDNLTSFINLCLSFNFVGDETFLISDKSDLSTEEIIRIIGKICGKKPRIFPFPIFLLKALFQIIGKKDLSQSLLGDLQINSDAHSNLNWRPPFKPKSILKNCE